MSTRFTPEFKDAAVRQITERGNSVAEVSLRLGVSVQSLYKWLNEVKSEPPDQQAYDFMAAKKSILKKTACYFARELE